MANVRVTQPHELGQAKAVEAMKQFDTFLSKYRVKLDWSGPTAKIKGTGVGGDVRVGDRDVTVNLELGMMARVAGIDPVRLEASIRKRLQESLAG